MKLVFDEVYPEESDELSLLDSDSDEQGREENGESPAVHEKMSATVVRADKFCLEKNHEIPEIEPSPPIKILVWIKRF